MTGSFGKQMEQIDREIFNLSKDRQPQEKQINLSIDIDKTNAIQMMKFNPNGTIMAVQLCNCAYVVLYSMPSGRRICTLKPSIFAYQLLDLSFCPVTNCIALLMENPKLDSLQVEVFNAESVVSKFRSR